MPIDKEYAYDKIGGPSPGSVDVFVGPCSVKTFSGEKIPTDGRKYSVHGIVHFKNGRSLPAKFAIDTSGFDFIVLGSVIVYLDGLWYKWDEDALVALLGAKNSEEILPFTWAPDRPLDFWRPAPYPMRYDPRARNKA